MRACRGGKFGPTLPVSMYWAKFTSTYPRGQSMCPSRSSPDSMCLPHGVKAWKTFQETKAAISWPQHKATTKAKWCESSRQRWGTIMGCGRCFTLSRPFLTWRREDFEILFFAEPSALPRGLIWRHVESSALGLFAP